ncbi:MAG TPA: response regulator transcription factor [Terriglobales bacterium]|nr:response regulator transcription factor [Terriglobales bacterium]
MDIAASCPISVLVADSNQMQCQLLVSALRRRPEFRVSSCTLESESILSAAASRPVQVAIMNADHPRDGWRDMAIVRRVHLSYPEVAKVLLLDTYDRELVINAFRSGAKGLFCFSAYPFRLLCKCIHSVHHGQIWANSEQLQYLVDGITQVPSLRVVNALGGKLLTPREEQVVALVADGLSNREIAQELNLSQHTVKKYLFRIFDKLGISSRVELVLYAVSHGGRRLAEWVPGSAHV